MYRPLSCLVAAGLVAALSGCSMCAHLYDDCGPTFTGGDCQQCSPNARAGSILSPGIEDSVGPEIVDGEEMVGGEMAAGDIVATKIISVTDEVVGEAPQVEEAAQVEQKAEEPVRTANWRARVRNTARQ